MKGRAPFMDFWAFGLLGFWALGEPAGSPH